ncbi:hypothetical protein MRX96_056653 [Rhipicephalus microplus]
MRKDNCAAKAALLQQKRAAFLFAFAPVGGGEQPRRCGGRNGRRCRFCFIFRPGSRAGKRRWKAGTTERANFAREGRDTLARKDLTAARSAGCSRWSRCDGVPANLALRRQQPNFQKRCPQLQVTLSTEDVDQFWFPPYTYAVGTDLTSSDKRMLSCAEDN